MSKQQIKILKIKTKKYRILKHNKTNDVNIRNEVDVRVYTTIIIINIIIKEG